MKDTTRPQSNGLQAESINGVLCGYQSRNTNRKWVEWVFEAANHDLVVASVVLGISVKELRCRLTAFGIPFNGSVQKTDKA